MPPACDREPECDIGNPRLFFRQYKSTEPVGAYFEAIVIQPQREEVLIFDVRGGTMDAFGVDGVARYCTRATTSFPFAIYPKGAEALVMVRLGRLRVLDTSIGSVACDDLDGIFESEDSYPLLVAHRPREEEDGGSSNDAGDAADATDAADADELQGDESDSESDTAGLPDSE